MSTVRWGIIGAGRIAHHFAKDIAFVANSKLVAVAARVLPQLFSATIFLCRQFPPSHGHARTLINPHLMSRLS